MLPQRLVLRFGLCQRIDLFGQEEPVRVRLGLAGVRVELQRRRHPVPGQPRGRPDHLWTKNTMKFDICALNTILSAQKTFI